MSLYILYMRAPCIMSIIFVCCVYFFHLGVYASKTQYIVINKDDNLCGGFTPGDSVSPNWLPVGWKKVNLDISIANIFRSLPSCSNPILQHCCHEAGYRYAGVPVGLNQVSEKRKSAEYLASKQIIERRNLHPSAYRLEDTITRKEMMKVIAQVSKLPKSSCKNSFLDVVDDWGCPYIEAVLKKGYIVHNDFFRPDDSITRTEALKLILQARNIEKRYNTQFWQQDYISTAFYLGFIDEKYSYYNLVATRGWIFQVLARTYGDDFKQW